MKTVIRTLNGADVHRLKETLMAVKRQPEIWEFTFRAINESRAIVQVKPNEN